MKFLNSNIFGRGIVLFLKKKTKLSLNPQISPHRRPSVAPWGHTQNLHLDLPLKHKAVGTHCTVCEHGEVFLLLTLSKPNTCMRVPTCAHTHTLSSALIYNLILRNVRMPSIYVSLFYFPVLV